MNSLKTLLINTVIGTVAAACFISMAVAISNEQQSFTNNVCNNNSKNTLSNEEREYVYQLIKDIESVFEFFQEKIELFIDLRDKTPYRKFVGDLGMRIDQFTNETLKPLEQKLKENTNNKENINKDEAYYRGLVVVDELLVEFLGKLHNMRLVLLKYVSVKDNPEQAFKLATELEPQIRALIATEVWNKLEAKLLAVELLMKQVEERDLMATIAQLKAVLKQNRSFSSKLNISPTTLVSCIRKKIRYN